MGCKTVVFPEGTRNHHPTELDLLPFKLGAFGAAIEAQVPIQPIVFSHYDFFDTKAKLLNPGGVQIHVLDPIPTDGLGPDNVEELAKETRLKMLQVFRHGTQHIS
jgi:lysophosphatidate acyltransferase